VIVAPSGTVDQGASRFSLTVDRDKEVCYTVDDSVGVSADTKEVKTMKKNWLRGLLLGVSLALLLAGGVAVAQALSVTVDQPCFQCYSAPPPTEDQILRITMNYPWPLSDQLCYGFTIEGTPPVAETCSPPTGPPSPGPGTKSFAIPCVVNNGQQALEIPLLDGAVVHVDGIEDLYGEWVWWLRNVVTGERSEVSFLFAEDCYAAMFVPEPGSILLLGSGLAGLAGYAALRWRARE
jgi:hypothetical protein